MAMNARVDSSRLIDVATAVYQNAGIPDADAHLVARTLVQADRAQNRARIDAAIFLGSPAILTDEVRKGVISNLLH